MSTGMLRHHVKWWLAGPLGRTSLSRVPEREIPIGLCWVFHTERLYDPEILKRFLRFLREFRSVTGTRAVACVMTPGCAEIRRGMLRHGVEDGAFAGRLARVAEHAVIGYHGHFYREDDLARPVHHGAPNDETIREQFAREVSWLRGQGWEALHYTGGWWFYNPQVVASLVEHRFRLDFSIRKGEVDCFGGRFPDDAQVPPAGEAFLMPGTESLLEVQSLFGPSDPPYWMVRRHLAPLLSRPGDQPLYGALHTHDFNLPGLGESLMRAVEFFAANPQAFRWRDIYELEAEARTAVTATPPSTT